MAFRGLIMEYAIFQIMRHAMHLNAERAYTRVYIDKHEAKNG